MRRTITDHHVVDETELVDVSTLDDRHIQALWRRAVDDGDEGTARLCWTATRADVPPDILRGARLQIAERWNDLVERGDSTVLLLLPRDLAFPQPSIPPAVAEITQHDPMVLMPVTFPCPLCHQGVVLVQDGEILRLPYHRTTGFFPFGLGGPVHSAECPGIGVAVYPICVEAHDTPACGDPGCWHRSAEAGVEESSPGDETCVSAESAGLSTGFPQQETTLQGYAYREDTYREDVPPTRLTIPIEQRPLRGRLS